LARVIGITISFCAKIVFQEHYYANRKEPSSKPSEPIKIAWLFALFPGLSVANQHRANTIRNKLKTVLQEVTAKLRSNPPWLKCICALAC